ncbi:MAG TPA: hypothetical protein PKN21_01315 [Bacteroidales bacterium]|nr:hypothetical protein [Bacteroidales bacterium]
MKINRDNYEAYFLDYHEGQLSPEMAREVLLFVDRNPDLANVFHEFEPVSLVSEQEIVFEKKSALKKNQVFATSLINETNYEEWFFDESEGLLNSEQKAFIEEFISINPQFEKDRRLFAMAHLTVDAGTTFKNKESLKQKAIPVGEINADTYETFMARELEGDLTPAVKQQLEEFLTYNPHLAKDRKLFALTKLSADTSVVFADKESLKHKVVPIRRMVYYALSTAASLALLFSVYFLLDRNNIPNNLAQQGHVKNKVNREISQPAQSIPSGNIAETKPLVTESGNTEAKNSTSNPENTGTVIPEANQEPALAMGSRQQILPLEPLTSARVSTRSYVAPEYTFIRMSQMYQNENLEFYYNLKLSEELAYAEANAKDKNPVKTLFNAVTGRSSGDMLASKQNESTPSDKKNISLWTVAEAGVQTFNKITSSDVELNLHKNEEGKVVGYDLESNLFNIEKSLAK